MGLRDKLGFNPFRSRKLVIERPEVTKLSGFHADYAAFCASLNPHQSDEWYRRGFEDFPVLLALPHVAHVGLTPDRACLLIGVADIDAYNRDGTCHEIGDIIVTYDPRSKAVTYENVTHPCGKGNSVYAHPHILNGTLCSSANEDIHRCFVDAFASKAARIIVRCLRMRSGEITRNTAFYDIANWPVKNGGTK
jgi:hypothetical protein